MREIANCNLLYDNGDYFAWGDTYPKSYYSWSTYFDTNDGGSTFDKYYNNGGKTELEDDDDVAVQTWGGAWKMPTKTQQDELRNECYWVWTNTYNGKSVKGYIVYKAKTEGDKGVKVYSGKAADASYSVVSDAHVFLPAAGTRYNGLLNNAGSLGCYWSRSLDTNRSYAYGLIFYSLNVNANNGYRYYGLSVRPVCPATE